MKRLVPLALAAAFALLPATVQAAPGSKAAPAKQGKMVFVANTGLEDLGTLSSSLRHAIAAKKSGHLSDVVWITYGRAIVALDPTVKAVPESLRKLAREAKAAGVRLVACASALEKYDIDPRKLEPAAEVVENAVTELARLVADGYAVIRY